jgi:hypothetical protein
LIEANTTQVTGYYPQSLAFEDIIRGDFKISNDAFTFQPAKALVLTNQRLMEPVPTVTTFFPCSSYSSSLK